MPNNSLEEFARKLEKARTPLGDNLYGLRSTAEIPIAARGFGLLKRKRKKPILKSEVV